MVVDTLCNRTADDVSEYHLSSDLEHLVAMIMFSTAKPPPAGGLCVCLLSCAFVRIVSVRGMCVLMCVNVQIHYQMIGQRLGKLCSTRI